MANVLTCRVIMTDSLVRFTLKPLRLYLYLYLCVAYFSAADHFLNRKPLPFCIILSSISLASGDKELCLNG